MMLDLKHIGVAHDENPPGRGSGRFAYGSGENPYQHQSDFLASVQKMKNEGLREGDIAKILLGDNARIVDLRSREAIEKDHIKKMRNADVIDLYFNKHKTYAEIADTVGVSKATVQNILKDPENDRLDRYKKTAQVIKEAVDKYGYVDVGKFAENHLGVTQYTKDVAVGMLINEGYVKGTPIIKVPASNRELQYQVLAKPGTTQSEIWQNRNNIKPITEYTPDEGHTWLIPKYPSSVNSDRIFIRYREDGGDQKDGVIELRKNVPDLSLGDALYSQVRIAVDNSHYMKGMAVYSDDIPDGYDIVYNTNKKSGTKMMSSAPDESQVLKPLKINKLTGEIDKDNPFGAAIKIGKEEDGVITAGGQSEYIGKDGKAHLSPINRIYDEGDWNGWSARLAAQFLSKQPVQLINQQIDLSVSNRKRELQAIMELTNPILRKRELNDFADNCDQRASSLSVDGFRNQKFQVILPSTTLKNNEVYAPGFKDGDTVALIRYPHAGLFEIPILKVNNKNKEGKSVLPLASDAVMINKTVADQLSGADYDGDTALVIPVRSNNLKIQSRDPLPGLVGWDPKDYYKMDDKKWFREDKNGNVKPYMRESTKQIEMGKITNLITDMTAFGADYDDIEKAVKHSMVVIDAVKHHLDYKQSYKDNNIDAIKRKYQGVNPKTNQPKGSATIFSRANAKVDVPERREITREFEMTDEELKRFKKGHKIYRDTGRTIYRYNKDTGLWEDSGKPRMMEVRRGDLVDDAFDLVHNPNDPKERKYAEYSNELKRLALEARKAARSIKTEKVNNVSQKTYKKEVDELMSALKEAESNNPKERIATAIAARIMKEKKESNPDMDNDHRKREEAIAMNRARALVGAKKKKIRPTQRQWEAMQSNAISSSKVSRIIANSDIDYVKKLAEPPRRSVRRIKDISLIDLNHILAMYASGMYTQRDIADRIGISPSLVSEIVRGERR